MRALIFIFILVFFSYPAQALNTCEQDALTYQKEHGGSLIFVIPLQSNGAYEDGRYAGHWMNYVSGEYIDAGTGTRYISPAMWFDRKSEYWDMSKEHPPFSLIRE